MEKDFSEHKGLGRGLSVNNPAYLKSSDNKAYQGRLPSSKDLEFMQFDNLQNGIAAFVTHLSNHLGKNGFGTVEEVVVNYVGDRELDKMVDSLCDILSMEKGDALPSSEEDRKKLARAILQLCNISEKRMLVTERDFLKAWEIYKVQASSRKKKK